jgi:UDP-glucose 4-epimerase
MGVKKFIFASSSSVYGNSNTLIQHETDRLCPTNPYAVSKLAAEAALTSVALGGNTELIIIRPFTMYGDYMAFGDDALVIGKFLQAWENEDPLFIHGNGEQSRDFLHAWDACKGIELIIEHGRHGDIFNLGTGESVTIKQLADIVSQKQVLVPDRKGSVERTQADISRLRALGYKPTVRVLDWLTEQVDERKLKEIIT